MIDTRQQGIFQRVGKWTVPDIVEKYRQLRGLIFILRDLYSFEAQGIQCNTHQVHCAKGMLKTCVQRPRIHIVGEPELLDVPETLEIGVGKNIENKSALEGNESVYRIVYYLFLVHPLTVGRNPFSFRGGGVDYNV
jgi:hypothetical protein